MVAALTIAGSDSGGGAGLQADLKTFAAHGVFGASAVTAITAQNTAGITTMEPLTPALVTAQVDAVISDTGAVATKTGMLVTFAIVDAVATTVKRHALSPLVVDPVLVATSGARLLDDGALGAMRERLFPLATVVTPNLPEAEAITGLAIKSDEDLREAARRLQELGPGTVIITGGHDASGNTVRDLLFDCGSFRVFTTPRVPGGRAHGTGCTFAATLTALLGTGHGLDEAIPAAQAYVAGALQHGYDGIGGRLLNHAWRSPS